MSSQVVDATQETAPLHAHPYMHMPRPRLGGEWGEEKGTVVLGATTGKGPLRALFKGGGAPHPKLHESAIWRIKISVIILKV